MKRYMLFAGDTYYPSGGAQDFVRDFDTIEDAMRHVTDVTFKMDWWHIFDCEIKTIVSPRKMPSWP